MAEYLNKVIKSNGNFGQIRYVGPIAGLNDDQTGKILTFFLLINLPSFLLYINRMVWDRMARS